MRAQSSQDTPLRLQVNRGLCRRQPVRRSSPLPTIKRLYGFVIIAKAPALPDLPRCPSTRAHGTSHGPPASKLIPYRLAALRDNQARRTGGCGSRSKQSRIGIPTTRTFAFPDAIFGEPLASSELEEGATYNPHHETKRHQRTCHFLFVNLTECRTFHHTY